MPRRIILGISVFLWVLGGFYHLANSKEQKEPFLATDAPWPMFHHDPKHTGKSPYPGTRIGALKWRFKTYGQVVSSPAIAADGTVYVGSEDNYFYAINRDGSLKWRYKTGNIIRSSPAIASDGTVYVGSFDGKLYAFNPDGTVKWSYQAGDGIESSPAIGTDGTIYVGSSDFNLYAINPDGSLQWSFFAGDAIGSSPAVGDDGYIYFGCWLEDVYVLDQYGVEICRWPTPTGGVFASPTITANGTVWIANDSAWVDTLGEREDLPERLKEPWFVYRMYPPYCDASLFNYGEEDVYSTPAVEADTSIFIGYGQKLLALNPDGVPNWSFETGGKVDSSPIIGVDGIIYVGSDDGNFYAIDPNCACPIWQYQTGGCIKSSAAIDNDEFRTIYIGSQDTYLYAFYDGFKVSGRVTYSGLGLSGVTMTLISEFLPEPVITITDSQGNYDFSGLQTPITYTVTPSKPGYYFIPSSAQVTILDASQENVDFVAALGFTISGQVLLDSSGLSSVTMVLSGTTSVTPTQTDSQGNYSFSDVVPGTYSVTPTKQGYGFSPPSRSVTVTDNNLTGINFTAEAGYSISGHVTQNGVGLSGATVTLSGGVSKVTETNSEGVYVFTGLQNGSYVVTPTKEGYQFDPPSQSVTVADANKDGINFTAIFGFTISGKVTIGGVGLSEVTMTLGGGISLTTTTDSQGEYSFSNLGNGTYTVTPSKAEYGFAPLSRTVTILNADVEDVDFSAAFGFSISGRVTINGNGLKGVTMTLSGDDSDTTTTDLEGNYVFTGLSDGSYTVTPTKQGYEFDPTSQNITISGATEGNVDFTAERVPLPRIFFIAPIVGVPGQLLNIIGANFGDEPGESGKVNFNTTTVKIRSWSNWKILVDLPEGSGLVKVSVTTDQGTSNEKNFLYLK